MPDLNSLITPYVHQLLLPQRGQGSVELKVYTDADPVVQETLRIADEMLKAWQSSTAAASVAAGATPAADAGPSRRSSSRSVRLARDVLAVGSDDGVLSATPGEGTGLPTVVMTRRSGGTSQVVDLTIDALSLKCIEETGDDLGPNKDHIVLGAIYTGSDGAAAHSPPLDLGETFVDGTLHTFVPEYALGRFSGVPLSPDEAVSTVLQLWEMDEGDVPGWMQKWGKWLRDTAVDAAQKAGTSQGGPIVGWMYATAVGKFLDTVGGIISFAMQHDAFAPLEIRVRSTGEVIAHQVWTHQLVNTGQIFHISRPVTREGTDGSRTIYRTTIEGHGGKYELRFAIQRTERLNIEVVLPVFTPAAPQRVPPLPTGARVRSIATCVDGTDLLFALDTDGRAWRTGKAGPWETLEGSLVQISAGGEKLVWGSDGQQAQTLDGSRFSMLDLRPGLRFVAVGADGMAWGVTVDGHTVSNRVQEDWRQLLRERPRVGEEEGRFVDPDAPAGWTSALPDLDVLAVGNARHVWGIDADRRVYAFQWETQRFREVSAPRAVSIAASSDGVIRLVDNTGRLYAWNDSTWVEVPHTISTLIQVVQASWRLSFGLDRAGRIYRWEPQAVQ